MPSRKTTEQCMTWVRSKAADRDSLDGINAQLVLNVLEEQRTKLDKLGAQFKKVKDSRDRIAQEIDNYVDNDFRLTESQKRWLEENGVEIVEF